MQRAFIPETQNYWRYELKYRLNYHQYRQVRNALVPYIQHDAYTKSVSSHRYVVRSLYFDSPDYQAYNEKLDGNYSRFKFRIRSYSDVMEKGSVIRIEIKVRMGAKTEKHGTIVSVETFCNFMEHYHWNCVSNPVLTEFERNIHARILRPKVLIEYYREGYVARSKEDIRITFDHRVCSAKANTLFPNQAFFRQHDPSQIILEIKHRDEQPDWLKTIVQTYSLKIEPNSKYCQGIEITQLDLVNHALRV